MIQKMIIILALNVMFFAKTIRFSYVSDDIGAWKNPPKYKNKWEKWFYSITGSLKINPGIDHLTTLIIHALICVFIYLGFGANNISFLAALLFTFNPANNQGSVWTSGRGYTLPALFILMAMTLPFLGPIFLFASSWYTVGFLAPIVLIGTKVKWLLLFMPIIWYLHRKKFITAVTNKANSETFTEDKRMKPRKLILAIKTVGFYLSLCLVPFRLAFYHSFLQSCAGNDIMRKKAYSLCKFFWIGLASIIAFCIYAIFHKDYIVTGMIWYFVGIAPFSNIKRNNQECSERFLYIANIGLMVALAGAIINYPIVITAFLAMYATRLWFYMNCYQDDFWLVEYSVAEDPGAWYGWHVRGMVRFNQSSLREALNMWVMCRMISPKEFKVLINIASVLRLIKQEKEAEEFLKLAEQNIVEGQEKEAQEVIKASRKGELPILL